MCAGQDFRSVCVQGSVVDVETAGNQAAENDVLDVSPDGGVCEEEGHGEQSANRHGVFASEELGVAHETGENGTGNTADVGQSVVAPVFVVRPVKRGTFALQVVARNVLE